MVSDCTIDGGEITEMYPSPQKQVDWNITPWCWTWSSLFNKFKNIIIRSAKIGIQLVATSDPNAPPDILGKTEDG